MPTPFGCCRARLLSRSGDAKRSWCVGWNKRSAVPARLPLGSPELRTACSGLLELRALTCQSCSQRVGFFRDSCVGNEDSLAAMACHFGSRLTPGVGRRFVAGHPVTDARKNVRRQSAATVGRLARDRAASRCGGNRQCTGCQWDLAGEGFWRRRDRRCRAHIASCS